ncbi:hypothetical protein P3H15_28535 [Rhodococcus sp. T2V]|uniref:hypothetical protein n=1 Tax=Rhodococcus sp. T2V TaxID=3034164 RepID=UPI0023E297FA|nr:hypothetical protein [Rhodococcus sp. T2V]MDF3308964.1 hypothetical protein [Rhodococcus sp. T2V]
MDHEEMYAKAQTMVPDAIGQLAQACHSISNALPLAFGFAILRNTISERWEGAAADAAAQATEKLAATSGQLTSSIAAIAVKLDILSSAAADVKASVPQPASTEGVLSQLPLSPLAAERSETEREAARLEAVRRLEAIYVPNYRDVGTNVPQLPEPYTPSGDGGPGGVPSTYGSVTQGSNPWNASDSRTSDSSTSSVSGNGDASVNGETPGDGESTGDDAATTSAANAEAAANQGAGAGAGSGSAAQTAAANAQNTAGAGSQSGNGAGGTGYGGIAGGSGVGGSGVGGSGVGGSGVGGSASSTRRKNDKRDSESNSGGVVPGGRIPSGGAAAGAGAAAAAAAATPVKPSMSRPGMGMAPGMMGAPGRAGGNSEGDTEHQTPSYLITVDNGNDLIGKLDPVAPPVIGA